MDNEDLLRIAKQRQTVKRNEAVKLSDCLGKIKEEIKPINRRFAAVEDVWNRVLPQELRSHSRIDDITGGRLKIKVDSPAYTYMLRMRATDILGELAQSCPAAKIKEIIFVLG